MTLIKKYKEANDSINKLLQISVEGFRKARVCQKQIRNLEQYIVDLPKDLKERGRKRRWDKNSDIHLLMHSKKSLKDLAIDLGRTEQAVKKRKALLKKKNVLGFKIEDVYPL